MHAACGRGHTVLVTDAGEAWSAGWNVNGQCGHDEGTEHVASFKRIRGGGIDDEKVVAASAGISHSLLLTETGKVYAVGTGEKGVLGNGRVRPSPSHFTLSKRLVLALTRAAFDARRAASTSQARASCSTRSPSRSSSRARSRTGTLCRSRAGSNTISRSMTRATATRGASAVRLLPPLPLARALEPRTTSPSSPFAHAILTGSSPRRSRSSRHGRAGRRLHAGADPVGRRHQLAHALPQERRRQHQHALHR